MSYDDDEDDDDDESVQVDNEELVSILDAIDTYCQPTVRAHMISIYRKDHDKLLCESFDKIECEIGGTRGDPGKLYPLHERVRRVIGALQADVILAKGSRR